MNDKAQIIAALREEFQRWEAILTSMSEAQITSLIERSEWSTKDVVAHLWSWQQRSIARMEAALHEHDPAFPNWPEGFDPEVPEEPDALNAWLYERKRDTPWPQVYADWKSSFQHFIDLGEAIPEADLLQSGHYAWLGDHPLALVLDGSREHHEEHRAWLTEWLDEQ